MPRLALYTFGVLKSPLTDPGPLTREFYDLGEAVYREIGQHPGHLAHAQAADVDRGGLFEADWGPWGEFAVPAWYGKGRTAETTALAATLSLWTGPRPAFDAVYTGVHRESLTRRYDWFERTGHPNHVSWWVADDATPTWRDGVSRLEHLHDHGPAPHAFTFRDAFAPDGTVTGIEGTGRGSVVRADDE
ncbi:DUF3291 domain-containing protein [Streptomyces sp. SID486]|uniref:DUF3291 domain-containing protein n=1 Tax=unclassified Streptomyces TaxID=2593676 RepID=UPI001370635C|nr:MULTISPECIES: DUF3291 domain-containing protein [unclassified Streptomyces]MYW47318.1 DUF3291 domain-containing protein [Streptomyces sp. SID161]MYX97500.1 DUF3291 domain-containing protein [Streptomyces sp. SID486]